MTMNRHRTVETAVLFAARWRRLFRPRRTAAFAAVLAALLLAGAPAAAEPTVVTGNITAHVGAQLVLYADEAFDDAGTNPRITGATFFSTTNYDQAYAAQGRVWVQVKTSEQLNALTPPPSNPFTVDVTVTMENDDGETASGTITLETTYTTPTLSPSVEPQPPTGSTNAPPGTLVTVNAGDVYTKAGTNPKFTSVSFTNSSKLTHPSGVRSEGGPLYVQVKTTEQLNAMTPPPPATFKFKANVTMVNDEGHRRQDTLSFHTTYLREEPPAPLEPVFNAAACMPDGRLDAPAGTLVSTSADGCFDNPGTNPVFTAVTFSPAGYYDRAEAADGQVHVQAKSDADLRAMPIPPPASFDVTATATMENDEDQTATATLVYRTGYDVDEPEDAQSASAPAFIPQAAFNLESGRRYGIRANRISTYFKNPGTNARFTKAVFSTTKYFEETSLSRGSVSFQTKYGRTLNAMTPPPPSPVSAALTLTMENDEGQTATGTLLFKIAYARAASAPAPAPAPTVIKSDKHTLFVNTLQSIKLGRDGGFFENVGTNPRFTEAVFSARKYLSRGDLVAGTIFVMTKTPEELRALSAPNPFRVNVTTTMVNDEGHSASGTFTFETRYDNRNPDSSSTP